MTVRATDGSETLLKHALPVPRGSAEPSTADSPAGTTGGAAAYRDFNPGPTAPP